MKTLILLLIFNLPSGESVEIAWKRGLSASECAQMAEEIWSAGSEIVGYDDDGAIPATDAVCVLPYQLSE